MPPRSEHVPVMLSEVLHGLDPQPGQVFVDGTMGGGGHTRSLAERVSPTGRVIALDRDPAAVRSGRESLADLPVNAARASKLPRSRQCIGGVGGAAGQRRVARPGFVERPIG